MAAGPPISESGLAVCIVLALILAAALYRWRDRAFRGVPRIDPQALGAFRIAFGTSLLLAALQRLSLPDRAPPGTTQESALWGDWEWVLWLGGHWNVRDALWLVTILALVAFIAGLFTRTAFAVAAAGLVVRLLVVQEYPLLAVSHAWAPHAVLLAALVAVPWGAGLSLDAWWRRRRGRTPVDQGRSALYGLALWITGLVVGVVFLAAAVSKLGVTGVSWVTGGAVKYHWAEDALAAPVGLGAWVASHQWAAVGAAFLGIVLEATLWLHVAFRDWRIRLAAGAMGAALLGGFWLFQGVMWPGWWVMLLAFLPWQQIVDGVRSARARWNDGPAGAVRTRASLATRTGAGPLAISRATAIATSALVALVVMQQVALSGAQVEQIPLATSYPMYNSTHPSEEAFNEARKSNKFALYEVDGLPAREAEALADRMAEAGVLSTVGEIAGQLQSSAGLPLPGRERALLAKAREDYARVTGQDLGTVALIRRERRFDFETGRLVDAGSVRLPAVDTAALSPAPAVTP